MNGFIFLFGDDTLDNSINCLRVDLLSKWHTLYTSSVWQKSPSELDPVSTSL